jgi:2,3-bisphosphoglycerate-independent phosphoglycerate mutase
MAEDKEQASRHTADILNEFTEKSYKVLNNHTINMERAKRALLPANIILSRGPGTLPPLEPLAQKYSVDTACIAVAPIVRGICRVAGMELVEVQGATGGLDTNFKAKVSAAIQAMKRHDLVFLHIKAADVASHDGDFDKKIWVIEKIDEAMAQVIDSVDLASDYVAMTSDHATPVTFRDHSADPVPVLIAGPDFDVSQTAAFSERTAATGNLGRLLALHLMPIMMNRLGKVEKFGF